MVAKLAVAVVHAEERGAWRARKRVRDGGAVLVDLGDRPRVSGLGAVARVGADERAVKGRDGVVHEFLDLGPDLDAPAPLVPPLVHGKAALADVKPRRLLHGGERHAVDPERLSFRVDALKRRFALAAHHRVLAARRQQQRRRLRGKPRRWHRGHLTTVEIGRTEHVLQVLGEPSLAEALRLRLLL